MREKLSRMLEHIIAKIGRFGVPRSDSLAMADYLIDNGVTIEGCNRDCANCFKTKLVNNVQQWISVKDRLPEKEGFYLVATKYGTVHRELYFLCGDPPEPSFGWCGVSKGKYTHWMPLPDPPKGE